LKRPVVELPPGQAVLDTEAAGMVDKT
jgi:hypothetical protein